MKKIALLLFTLLFFHHVNGQLCSAPSFTSQQQIDDFKIQNPGCKTISGDVSISGPDITNLNGLSGISTINGNLNISSNPALKNLNGLGSLVNVGGRLTIYENSALLDVSGLESVGDLSDGINVVSNAALTNFSGLKSLHNVGTYLRIVYNPSLTSIEAFNKISSVTDFLSIGGNDALESLSGLDNVATAREVSISLNKKLKNLHGLKSLTNTSGYFYIADNPLLTDLQGLNKLKSVSNYFYIFNNDGLNSLTGLDGLDWADALFIQNSDNLSACSVKGVCSVFKSNPDHVSVSSNAPGCNSVQEVNYNCASPAGPMRINAGGSDFNASGSKLFSADQYFAGIDRISAAATGDILNTSDDPLYQTARCSPWFSYNIPVANGNMTVILHFAETWFGVPGKGAGGAGKRQFHVNIEGVRKLANFDIFASAGGAMRAIQKSIPVTVTDGMLNIDFMTGATDLPRVSAIEVIVTGANLRPEADAYVRDGSYNIFNFGSSNDLDIKSIPSDLSKVRSSYLRFQLPPATPIISAKLRIYGHNHENNKDISVHAYGVDDDSWTENGISKSNAPAASTPSLGFVGVNSILKYYELDVTGYVKNQQQSGNTLVSLLLADPNNRNTRVVFNSKENSSNPPQLVIQTSQVSLTARTGEEEVPSELKIQQAKSSVYPNPLKKHFTLDLSMQHSGNILIDMIDESGKSRPIEIPEKPKAGHKTKIDLTDLSLNSGIYMLKIHSDSNLEVIKLLVTD